MPDLFGMDIAGLVADTLGPQLVSMTLTRRAAATFDEQSGDVVQGADSVYTFSGIIEELMNPQRPGSRNLLKHRKVLILTKSVTLSGAKVADFEPLLDDLITTDEGNAMAVFEITERDPAAATWMVLVR